MQFVMRLLKNQVNVQQNYLQKIQHLAWFDGAGSASAATCG
jgi:hypothetical protein